MIFTLICSGYTQNLVDVDMLSTILLYIFFLVIFLGACALLINYYQDLSDKRRQRVITDEEKWIQGFISLPLKPILEGILSKDPFVIKSLITFTLCFSALLTSFFSQYGVVVFITVGVVVFLLWSSDD